MREKERGGQRNRGRKRERGQKRERGAQGKGDRERGGRESERAGHR